MKPLNKKTNRINFVKSYAPFQLYGQAYSCKHFVLWTHLLVLLIISGVEHSNRCFDQLKVEIQRLKIDRSELLQQNAVRAKMNVIACTKTKATFVLDYNGNNISCKQLVVYIYRKKSKGTKICWHFHFLSGINKKDNVKFIGIVGMRIR